MVGEGRQCWVNVRERGDCWRGGVSISASPQRVSLLPAPVGVHAPTWGSLGCGHRPNRLLLLVGRWVSVCCSSQQLAPGWPFSWFTWCTPCFTTSPSATSADFVRQNSRSTESVMVLTRFVEIGRVCLVNFGKFEGNLVVILDVANAAKMLVQGLPGSAVGRELMNIKRLSLTDHKLTIGRNARTKTIKKALDESGVQEKWDASAWGKRVAKRAAAKSMGDFARFKAKVAKQAVSSQPRTGSPVTWSACSPPPFRSSPRRSRLSCLHECVTHTAQMHNSVSAHLRVCPPPLRGWFGCESWLPQMVQLSPSGVLAMCAFPHNRSTNRPPCTCSAGSSPLCLLEQVVVHASPLQHTMAASEELRIVPVRGLNDIHKKRTHLPKPVMGLLQGLQYSLPTFAFHTFGACCAGTRGFPHHAAA